MLREQKQTIEELTSNAQTINIFNSKNFFYLKAKDAKHNANKKNRFDFCFKTINECAKYLISLYIDQGGRCAYSSIPIYPTIKHKYRISIERINSLGNYEPGNIVLIVAAFNCPPSGQMRNVNLTDEQRQLALKKGSFNQEYWDTCTLLTPERKLKCIEAKEYGKTILQTLVTT